MPSRSCHDRAARRHPAGGRAGARALKTMRALSKRDTPSEEDVRAMMSLHQRYHALRRAYPSGTDEWIKTLMQTRVASVLQSSAHAFIKELAARALAAWTPPPPPNDAATAERCKPGCYSIGRTHTRTHTHARTHTCTHTHTQSSSHPQRHAATPSTRPRRASRHRATWLRPPRRCPGRSAAPRCAAPPAAGRRARALRGNSPREQRARKKQRGRRHAFWTNQFSSIHNIQTTHK